MTGQRQTGPISVDTGAVFALLTEWAAQFHDDSSPAQVTDVLMVFAFVAGLNLALAGPEAAVAFLRWLEVEMPSAGQHARSLAQRMLDSMTREQRQDLRPGLAELGPSHSS